MFCIVITTIQEPTPSVIKLAERLVRLNGTIVVAGDSKGPASFDLSIVPGLRENQLIFLTLDDQLDGEFKLARLLPTRHYSRKNVAYLQAISLQASCIYETDDDNAPLPSWNMRGQKVSATQACGGVDDVETAHPKWVNVYKQFSTDCIWPRGLPLDRIHDPVVVSENLETKWSPIQQGLVDGSPDVDAIWRLVMDKEFVFTNNASVRIEQGSWCPFNTQSTWWWPAVFPLLYVPSYCSFRMCDIWKSFVAQRCLWELGAGVVFHAPEVIQDRNEHDLMMDFNDEVVGYQKNNQIAVILESLELSPGLESLPNNMMACYSKFVEEQILPKEELILVEAWLEDLDRFSNSVEAVL